MDDFFEQLAYGAEKTDGSVAVAVGGGTQFAGLRDGFWRFSKMLRNMLLGCTL